MLLGTCSVTGPVSDSLTNRDHPVPPKSSKQIPRSSNDEQEITAIFNYLAPNESADEKMVSLLGIEPTGQADACPESDYSAQCLSSPAATSRITAALLTIGPHRRDESDGSPDLTTVWSWIVAGPHREKQSSGRLP